MKTPYSTIRISPGLEVRSKHLPSKLEEERIEKVHRHAWQDRLAHDEEYLAAEQKGWWAEISKTKPSPSIDNGIGSLYDLDRRPLSDRFASHSRMNYSTGQTHQPAALSHRPLHSHDAAISHSRHFREYHHKPTNGLSSNNRVNYTIGVPPDTNTSTINLEVPIHSTSHTDRNYQIDGNNFGQQSNENGWWKSNIGGSLTLPDEDTKKRLYLQDGRPHSDKYVHQTMRQREPRRRSHQPAALDHRPSHQALPYGKIRDDLGHRPTHNVHRSQISNINRSTGQRSKHTTHGYVPSNQLPNVSPRTKTMPNELDSLTPYQQHLKQNVLSQSRHFSTTQLKQRHGHQENNGPPQAIQISISVNKRDSLQK